MLIRKQLIPPVILAFTIIGGVSPALAQQSATLERLIQAKPGQQAKNITPVRAAVLKSTAQTLGTQTGLIERSVEIMNEIDARKEQMESSFRFGDMVIGAGVLPPVIVRGDNAVAVSDSAMRVAGSVYRLVEPARFFSGAPSWRDWLLMGLITEEQTPDMPTNEQLLPRDADERAFWAEEVKKAYIAGRAQAQEIFEHNLSQLEETYLGMRTFYELYHRNMVSAPVIAKSQEIVTQDDPNTIIVGDTLFRITQPSQFNTKVSDWKALAATPRTKEPLPVVFNFDPEQVLHAFNVAEEIKERNAAQAAAAAMQGKSKKGEKAVVAANEVAPATTSTTSTTMTAEAMAVSTPAPVVETTIERITIRSQPTPPSPSPAPASKPTSPTPKLASQTGVVIDASKPLFTSFK